MSRMPSFSRTNAIVKQFFRAQTYIHYNPMRVNAETQPLTEWLLALLLVKIKCDVYHNWTTVSHFICMRECLVRYSNVRHSPYSAVRHRRSTATY